MDEEKKNAGIGDHLKAISDIVDKLEHGELSLEEALSVFSEGVAHVREARSLLSDAEEKLRILTEEGEPDDF